MGKTIEVRREKVDEASVGQRIDNYLLRMCKGVPKSHIYRILRSGEVRVNGGRVSQTHRLAMGDEVRIPPLRMSETAPVHAVPVGQAFTVVHDRTLTKSAGTGVLAPASDPDGDPITATLSDWTTIREELYNNVQVLGAHPLAVGAQAIGGDPEMLSQVLLGHLVEGAVLSAGYLVKTGSVTTAAGGELTVSEAGNVVTVGGTATVIDADLVAGNGLIHAIDMVLLPTN